MERPGDGDDDREFRAIRWIQIEEKVVRMVKIGEAIGPRIVVDATEAGQNSKEARSLAVPGTDRASVLEVAPLDSGSHIDYGILRFDRNGATLGELTSLPWQTVVIRDDGFVDMRGGITIWPTADGGLSIVNRFRMRLR